MSDQHCVIVGGSHAGAQLCASLRQEGWTGAITLVSDEALLPYHRPPLSKAFLCGDKAEQELLIRPQAFYEKEKVDVLLGTRAVAIDRARRQLALGDGSHLHYSKLVLATGARVRTLDIAGSALPGVFYLRQAHDVLAIRQATAPGKRAVIIGGGYIGLEAAASLRQTGMQVTVLEAMPRLLQRVTAPEVSAFYARVHGEEGVNIVTDASVLAIEGKERVEAVVTGDGRRLGADVVIIGVGVLPASELAQQAGLTVDNGIVVDECARTSDPDIFAVGDCSNHYNPIYDCRLRLESVQNATDQARTAAQALCGKTIPYRALPWFWSDQYDLKLQIAGLSQGYDRVVLRGSAGSGRSFSAFYFKGGRLIAVDAVNRPKDFMISKRFLADQASADPERVGDETIELRDCFSSTKTEQECLS
ncbi:NAD(P)/FAD-dependent oxidoreductase [Massilia cavernae]|uniref:Pyridine nucleotide-disulfide oxidoreductase n=1 Tax=Massilia cavernae TaxID=2320864 RepID=A0A418Y0R1_9BURK|nr:FAD-dependent oxidoreductase [Massilia cavernae]RJG18910.1 pyridine nucleotide-disulfide oxidoreductase [Massilia cavernae]